MTASVISDWSSWRVKGSALVGGGAKPNEQDALGFATGAGEYREFTLSEFARLRFKSKLILLAPFAALIGRCPIPRWWRCPICTNLKKENTSAT